MESFEGTSEAGTAARARVNLYWLPLGAGGRSVRVNGLVFERLSAVLARRAAGHLYHSALSIEHGRSRHVSEMAPAFPHPAEERGQVLTGPVGAGWAGRLAIFRYEVRCWEDGSIPDLEEAVDSPRCLSERPDVAADLIAEVRNLPALTWGRDERDLGEMWNSNSVISWLLEIRGLKASKINPPAGGRAPGWRAGVEAARRRGSNATT